MQTNWWNGQQTASQRFRSHIKARIGQWVWSVQWDWVIINLKNLAPKKKLKVKSVIWDHQQCAMHFSTAIMKSDAKAILMQFAIGHRKLIRFFFISRAINIFFCYSFFYVCLGILWIRRNSHKIGDDRYL